MQEFLAACAISGRIAAAQRHPTRGAMIAAVLVTEFDHPETDDPARMQLATVMMEALRSGGRRAQQPTGVGAGDSKGAAALAVSNAATAVRNAASHLSSVTFDFLYLPWYRNVIHFLTGRKD